MMSTTNRIEKKNSLRSHPNKQTIKQQITRSAKISKKEFRGPLPGGFHRIAILSPISGKKFWEKSCECVGYDAKMS